MAEELEQATQEELSEFDPAKLPKGTFAPFDVSDQPEWTTKSPENLIDDDKKAAIRAMLDSAAKSDAVARRIEVQGAWMLELLDRGFHRLKPSNTGGWEIYGSTGQRSNYGIFGAAAANNYYDTNVIGEKNDIITACLVREIAEATFFPECPDNPDDMVYASAANSLKHFIAEENKYGERQAEVARFFCTDERCVAYTRPVADAQRWGYEEPDTDFSPETEGEPEPKAESKRPKIRTVTEIFGKLKDKCPIMAPNQNFMQYRMLSEEWDIARARATFPWIRDQITAGDLNVSEVKLDKLARQSICLAMQSNFATGDSLMRDCTITRIWFRPAYYMDDSCPKPLRAWFWENFPKGFVAVYAAGELAYVRNEGMDEVLTEFHARSGNGQNRRALTESYMGCQMRLNVLVDLWDEFCRKEIPRVGLNTEFFNVEAIRASSARVGVYEPFTAQAGRNAQQEGVVVFPTPPHSPTMPDFIEKLSGEWAEQLTHAQPTLAAAEGDDPETLGQSKLQNNNAMSAFGESWKAILQGFANAMTQAVSWNARVQPEEEKFDAEFPGKGRVKAAIKNLKLGSAIARADNTSNFPESFSDRKAEWLMALQEADNPFVAKIVTDPRTLANIKNFLPRGAYLEGVDAIDKQKGEFDVLLKTAPQDNPQFLKLQMLVQQGTQETAMQMQQGGQVDPQQAQMLQQAQQMLQSIPPKISSVPVRGDGSENDAVEALACLSMMNSEEGRRLANSKDPQEQAAFENLHLHWQQHQQSAQKLAAQNQQPIPPKTSINVDASKLPPGEQAKALEKMGIAADPQSLATDDAMQPHEYTTKEKGVGPSGSEIERTVSVVGKKL